jgi:cobalt/nickel transport system permease protein
LKYYLYPWRPHLTIYLSEILKLATKVFRSRRSGKSLRGFFIPQCYATGQKGEKMHIPDGFLSHGINAATFVISTGACAYGVKRVNRSFGEREVPLMGVTAAFVFAAQMINFPVAGGTSGHFLGAVFSSVLLGPWASLIVMTIVLVVQCLGFADGGLTAIGSNIFNMGVMGALGGYGVFITLYVLLRKSRKGFFIALAISSWFSIMLGASAAAIELAISGTSPLKVALPAMAGTHALIGIGEAIITTTAVSLILKTRPDLVGAYAPPSLPRKWGECERGGQGGLHEKAS